MTAMQAESLEVLEKADVAPAQARAIVRAIEIEIAGAKATLATKSDLALLGQDLRHEMTELRQELRQEMSELRQELRREMSDLRIEVKADLLRLETKLEGKIHEIASSITRQMYTAILGQMAVLLGFAYFFATHVH
jgi:predicted Holliday junction resolvase-like endonuclease